LFGKIFGAMIDVHADSENGDMWRIRLRAHLHQNSGNFFPVEINIIGRFHNGGRVKLLCNRFSDCLRCPIGQACRLVDVDLRS
jgi:hypothetical protein